VNSKKRVIKDYESLPEDIKNGIKMTYPRGFAQHLVYYTDRNGKRVSALPFETEDIYYLVRMTVREAVQIIEDDEDYDSEGVLRDDFAMSGSDDEEIFESVKEEEETPIYNHVFKSSNILGKTVLEAVPKYYTTDTAFLKDTQQLIKQFNSV
jgi:hypothetical protein